MLDKKKYNNLYLEISCKKLTTEFLSYKYSMDNFYKNRDYSGCNGLLEEFFLNHDGNIYPCIKIKTSNWGNNIPLNLYTSNVESLSKSTYFKKFHNEILSKECCLKVDEFCRKCKYFEFCKPCSLDGYYVPYECMLVYSQYKNYISKNKNLDLDNMFENELVDLVSDLIKYEVIELMNN